MGFNSGFKGLNNIWWTKSNDSKCCKRRA